MTVVILHGAVLTGARLNHTNLTGADLVCAVLDGVDFSQTDITKATVPKGIEELEGDLATILEDHHIWVTHKGAKGARAELPRYILSDQDFRSVNLSMANLAYSKFQNANFSRAHLIMADLSFCDLRGADLSYCDLRGAGLTRANLAGANLIGARLGPVPMEGTVNREWTTNLQHARLNAAELRGADFQGANLEGADLTDAARNDSDMHRALLVDANLTGADMRGADLTDADVRGATGLKHD